MLLIFKSGPREGTTVDINGDRVTIGRVAENDIQLSDEKVSRHHAVIEVHEGRRIVLRDLGSRNGTFVDGQRLAGSCVLRGGEQLRFGDQQLSVEGARLVQARAAATPAERAPAGERDGASGSRPAALARRRRGALALAVATLAALVVFG